MKTLIIAEKPSVGRDIATALDGVFQKRTLADLDPKRKKATKDEPTFLESDDNVIAWAVGHLVQLAEPEEYDEKWKKWRMADLPIVPPNGFKLVPRDAKSKKQLKLVETLLKRDDVDRVVNACDAGREGRADLRVPLRVGLRHGADQPGSAEARRPALDQLDDEAGDPRRVRPAAPRRSAPTARVRGPRTLRGRLARRHERDPRGDDPRPRLGRRGRLARPRPDADARDHRPARARDPGVRPRAVLARARELRPALRGPLVRPDQGRRQGHADRPGDVAQGGRARRGDRRARFPARPGPSRTSSARSSPSVRRFSTT